MFNFDFALMSDMVKKLWTLFVATMSFGVIVFPILFALLGIYAIIYAKFPKQLKKYALVMELLGSLLELA